MTQPQILSQPTAARSLAAAAALAPLRVSYASLSGAHALAALLAQTDVLAVVGFGDSAPMTHADPRYLHVALQPVDAALFEVWRAQGAVTTMRTDLVRWASDGDYAFGVLELEETRHGDIEGAAATAYRSLVGWLAASPTPHVLRIWNYLDAINLGGGDAERYRRFCSGRAAGLQPGFVDAYPAATAIGVRDGRRVLQMYWLAARSAGTALENPRQLSAWRYPREYGPHAPSFARAMRAPASTLQVYISGTAAIVGHRSHHREDVAAQLDETLANIGSLLAAARIESGARFGANCLLKVYVRRAADIAAARAQLAVRLPADTPLLLLCGDICRSELLIEIDGVQGV
ncbi:MAG: pteridine-dependent deoxygenase [Rudaea sp.]